MLFLVATPIGNLEDISMRALRVLKEVDLIACEDTRHSRKLLQHYGVGTPLTSFYEHNERDKGERLLVDLQAGRDIALISDAGTPAISDPGYRLVRRCHEAGVEVSIIPGPQAAVSSLAVSGLPTDRFAFEGFLPARSGARRDFLSGLLQEERTLVFYESPHRLAASLETLAELCPEREAVVVRELTKLHEEICRGSAEQLAARWRDEKVRGEVVLLLAPAPAVEPEMSLEEALAKGLTEGRPVKELSRELAKVYDRSGSDIYALAVALKDRQGT